MPRGRPPQHSPEFKRDAIELVRTSDQRLETIARDLGIPASTLRWWIRQDRIDRGAGARGGLTNAEREELVRLRRENVQLRMERDILKNATAFFAREATQ
jgi:transposase